MKISELRKLQNSGGAPRWEVTFDDGTVARTAAGSQVAYSIENSEYQGVPLDVAWRDGEIIGVAVA